MLRGIARIQHPNDRRFLVFARAPQWLCPITVAISVNQDGIEALQALGAKQPADGKWQSFHHPDSQAYPAARVRSWWINGGAEQHASIGIVRPMRSSLQALGRFKNSILTGISSTPSRPGIRSVDQLTGIGNAPPLDQLTLLYDVQLSEHLWARVVASPGRLRLVTAKEIRSGRADGRFGRAIAAAASDFLYP